MTTDDAHQSQDSQGPQAEQFSALPTLSRHEAVYVLRLANPADSAQAPQNTFTPDFLGALEACLAEVESVDGPAALVTIGAGKFFSNGLDLEYVGSNPGGLPAYLTRIHAVYARLLRLPMPTVAALNGHAFGGGAMLALCHDLRLMRDDRGFWCLPEAGLKMPFPPGMNSLVTTVLGVPVAAPAMLTGRRYDAAAAVGAGIAHAAVPTDRLLDQAVEEAAGRAALAGPNLAGIRTGIMAGVLADLDTPVERV